MLHERLRVTQEELRGVEVELTDLTETLEARQKKEAALSDEIAQLRSQYAESQHNAELLRDELTALKAADKETEFAAIRAEQIATYRDQVRQLSTERESLQTEYQRVVERNMVLRRFLSH